MKEMERREFLKLARDTSAGAVIPGAMGRDIGDTLSLLMRYTAVDLDYIDSYVSELQDHFQRGDAGYVLKEARHYIQLLEQAGFPAKVSRATEIQMRLSLLLARAQECLLPWYERTSPTICTYNHIEAVVLPKLPQRSYPFYYAQLLTRRASLYREMSDLGKSVEQFTLALNYCQSKMEDSELLVELYYSRAHIWAIIGDEQHWQADLDRAKEYAQKVEHGKSGNLFRLITYTEGEGYKRLAYNQYLDLPAESRARYAAQGIGCFKRSHLEQSQWVGHALLSGVAEAQCLILLEPQEAICRAESLRREALRLYPSIVQKIDRTINAAEQHLR